MKPRLRTALTCLVLTLLACAGGEDVRTDPSVEWLAETRDRVEEAIEDPQRRGAVLAQVDRLEAALKDFERRQHDHRAAVGELYANHDATRSQFEALFAEFEAMRREFRSQMLDIRAAMVEITTTEEWARLTDVDESLFQSWARDFKM